MKAVLSDYTTEKDRLRGLLSEMELNVLGLIIEGKTAEEIAEIVFRSKRTIQITTENIKSKFQVKNIPCLITKSIYTGLYRIEE